VGPHDRTGVTRPSTSSYRKPPPGIPGWHMKDYNYRGAGGPYTISAHREGSKTRDSYLLVGREKAASGTLPICGAKRGQAQRMAVTTLGVTSPIAQKARLD